VSGLERCPLTAGGVAGFVYSEDIPEICLKSCEELWEQAIKAGISSHEEYPKSILYKLDCQHLATEHGNSTLQAVDVDSALRLYGSTERCLNCRDEIAEDSFMFECPNN
jgi:hypothetical protein